PAEGDASRWPLRLLTGPGHFQHHTVFAGVERLQRREGEPSCLLHPDDARARGLRDGDLVALQNDRGAVALRARVTGDTQPGVAVVPGRRPGAAHAGAAATLNVLTADALSDFGGGATYQSTWVDARRLDGGS